MCISVNEMGHGRNKVSARYKKIARLVLPAVTGTIFLFAIGCSVGPKYVRPSVQSPTAYKELPQGATNGSEAFRTAQPQDAATRGKWWEIFNDPQLNALEEK